jgi:hypothetical protein
MNSLDSRALVPHVKAAIRLRIGAVFFAISVIAFAAIPSLAIALTDKNVESLALQWFAEMQSGRIDRTQLTPEYSAELTPSAVQGMSQYLKEYDYSVPPSRAEVVQTRRRGDQAFYVVKLVFPRGDAGSLLFGFNQEGKITGISLLSMAGD